MNKADVEINHETAIAEGHECVVLAALMNGADDLPISADDFSSPPNRTIFERISGLTNRCPLAVQDALQRNGELDEVGGVGRFTEIATMTHDEPVLKYSLDQVLELTRTAGGEDRRTLAERRHDAGISARAVERNFAAHGKRSASN